MELIILMMGGKIFILSARKVFMYAGMQELATPFTWLVRMERSGNLFGLIK
jgi:hypothetical protein